MIFNPANALIYYFSQYKSNMLNNPVFYVR